MPRDLSAWKTGDEKWMAARQRGWKAVRTALTRHLYVTDKSDLELMKSFYLTGDMPPDWKEELSRPDAYYDWEPDRPLLYLSSEAKEPILFECWLHPEPTDDTWREIKDRYAQLGEEKYRRYWYGSREFLHLLLGEYPPKGTIFGDLEERLYAFSGTRCRPEDFPHLSRGPYVDTVRTQYYPKVDDAMRQFLRNDDFNWLHPVRLLVQEWADMLLPYCEYSKARSDPDSPWHLFLQGRVANAQFRLRCADASHPAQVKMAEEILAAVEKLRPELPAKVVEGIDQAHELAERLMRERCPKGGG